MIPVIEITKDHILKTSQNRPQNIINLFKGLIIHYTANTSKGANAKRNRDYFNNTSVYASTQYLIDDLRIIEALPYNEVGWAVGSNRYTAVGKSLYNGSKQPNYTTCNIEMCVNSDADYFKVTLNTLATACVLMDKCKLNLDQVYRHYDVTGKNCHGYYIQSEDWKNFKALLETAWKAYKANSNPVFNYWTDKGVKIKCNELNCRKGPSGTYELTTKYNKDETVRVYEKVNGWYRTDKGYISSSTEYSTLVNMPVKANIKYTIFKQENDVDTKPGNNPESSPSVTLKDKAVIILADVLNCRKGPSTNFDIVCKYKEKEEVFVYQSKDGWYRTNEGWINSSSTYTKLIDKVKEPPKNLLRGQYCIINSSDGELNCRKEPDSKSALVKTYKTNEIYELFEEKNKWYRTKDGWVSSTYIIMKTDEEVLNLNYDAILYDANLVEIGKANVGDLILLGNTVNTHKDYVNIVYKGKNVYIKKLIV